MQQYTIDVLKSETLYDEMIEFIQPRRCYLNVFYVGFQKMDEFSSGRWKIAYGYLSLKDKPKFLVRHCYIMDVISQKVIDPTAACLVKRGIADYPEVYRTMYVFDSPVKYIEAVEADHEYPALVDFLKEYDEKMLSWAKENGFLIFEPDFENF